MLMSTPQGQSAGLNAAAPHAASPRRADKPGARKRKVAPLLPSVSDMSQLPTHMLVGPDFTAPRVKRAAG